jgi:putative copper export protein
MSSHAMGAETARTFWVAADGIHALAAGTWIGTLIVVLTAARPRTLSTEGAALLAAQLRAFSPLAVVSVTALLVMGGALALDHLAGLSNLWRTTYGRILTAKVGLAGAVMLTGLWNWRKGLPSSDTPEGSATVQRHATLEVSLALGVLLLTAVLVHSAKP